MQLYRDALSGAGHEVDDFIDSVDAYSRFQEVRCPNFRRKDGRDVRSSISKYTKEVNKDVQIFLMSAFEFNKDHHSDPKEIELKEFRKECKDSFKCLVGGKT
jgi:hypothetical protein